VFRNSYRAAAVWPARPRAGRRRQARHVGKPRQTGDHANRLL